jgi:uncharacterized protein (TIGR03503 family)
VARLMLLFAVFLHCGVLAAQQNSAPPEGNATPDTGLTILDPLPVRNQIPLLDNRFRIDDGVDSITLVFFRRQGTASVVLVRPDGSKVFYNTAEQHDMRWHDAATYDLIEINNPMPGPWQAVGRILPESRILVLTDIQLQVDPLPTSLMVGETFKLTARLMDGEQVVNARDFREILTLQVLFISTNNKEQDSYGRGLAEVAVFRDDGRGYDASARDGVFTGEINLTFGAGEWIPRYVLKTPLYSRELEQPPVVIAPAPVQLVFQEATKAELPHKLSFQAAAAGIDLGSLLFQGVVRYPDGDMLPFALTDPAEAKELTIANKGAGSYLVDVSVFGQMQDGREFVLNLPQERFLVMLQAQAAPALAEPPTELQQPVTSIIKQPEPVPFPWSLVILSNVLILGLGALTIWLVMSGRGFGSLLFWRKNNAPAAGAVTPDLARNQAANSMKPTQTKEKDDILDLSLPDD